MSATTSTTSRDSEKRGDAYWNPYVAGLLLGATLVSAYVVLGAGLGASGGIARVGASLEATLLPEHVAASEYFGRWGDQPLEYYLVYMFAGVFAGGFLSSLLAGRMAIQVDRGATFPKKRRLALALTGGIIVGYASRLASGCTSGQALSGGALLLTGSLLFLFSVFAGGYAVAFFLRRQWL